MLSSPCCHLPNLFQSCNCLSKCFSHCSFLRILSGTSLGICKATKPEPYLVRTTSVIFSVYTLACSPTNVFYHYFSSYMWELVQNTKVLTSLKIRHYLSMENPLILVSCEKLYSLHIYAVIVLKYHGGHIIKWQVKKKRGAPFFSCFCRVPGLSLRWVFFFLWID